jgi:hypothetical protein
MPLIHRDGHHPPVRVSTTTSNVTLFSRSGNTFEHDICRIQGVYSRQPASRDMANIAGQDREASDRVIAGTVYTDTLAFRASEA